MEETYRRELQELRRVYEHTRGGEKKSRLLDTIIGQHAFVMIDLVRMRDHPQARDALIAKLKDVQEKWTNVLLYRAGQNTKNTLDKQSDAREYRFQRVVYSMVEEFVNHLKQLVLSSSPAPPGIERSIEEWVNFYGLLSADASRFYQKTLALFQDYVWHVHDVASHLKTTTDQTAANFYIASIACVVAGARLGAWLDLIL